MAELQIVCLGDFQVTLAGAPLTTFQTEKVRALLAYLAVEGRVHQRSELAQFLWSGYSEASARNSLRQAIHQLRQLLPDGDAQPSWLLVTRQSVRLNPDAPIVVDVTTFTRLLAECASHAHDAVDICKPCLARLRQATALYQGDFLGDFTVADSDPFEEWRRVVQEQLHIQMLDALAVLAKGAEAAGDEEGALQAAQRQLLLEPWLEAAHRQIMRILAQRGQRAAAIAQYNRCRQVLVEEFNVEPETATLALYQQIVDGVFDTVVRRSSELVKMSVDSAADALARDEIKQASPQPEPRQAPTSTAKIDGAPVPSAVPALDAALPPHYLPSTAYAIVGRTEEIAAIREHLQSARLLTVMGSGGMGKTRLALEIGRQTVQRYADGVWFVALAAVSSPSAIALTVATTMGLTLQGSDPNAALCQLLRHKQLLLILDNFEHLLGEETALDLVVELLSVAPGMQILVTSRERLKLRGEQLYPLSALPFSPAATLAEAAASPAVHLFVQALQRMQPNFQLTAINLAAVLRICQLVEGMPLGLELAAANARGVPLTAIADAIEQSAEFLGVDWQDLPERQRSMRAVFAWSWQLLSAAEQRVLRQSAIFRGGFDYTAAQAVIDATPALLTALVDKSLLQWQAAATGEGRYALHELLRQFAAEELDAAGERGAVAAQHGRYYLSYLAARGLRLGRGEPKQASAEIQPDLDNVRQAWQWAASQGRLVELEEATYAWWQFCQFCDLEAEGRQSFGAAVTGIRRRLAQPLADEKTALLGQRLLSKLLAIHADYLFAQGSDAVMAAQAREAIQLGATSGGGEGETFGTFVLARALHELDQRREAEDLWRQTIQLVLAYQPTYPESELLHEVHWMAHTCLRGSALHFGDYGGSRAYMVQALQLAQRLGKRRCELISLSFLGQTDVFLFDFVRAAPSLVAAIDLARTLGYRRSEMDSLEGVAVMARLRGDYTTALRLLEQNLMLATELALPYDESFALAALVRLHCQLGNAAAAMQRSEQLTKLLALVKLPRECQLAGCLALAFSMHYAGDAQVALRYAEQANQFNEQGEILFRLVDTALILGHTRMAAGQWAAAAMAFEQALAAFTELDKPALAAEAQAGLAQIALAQGDLAGAQVQIVAILPVLAEQPHAGYNNSFFIYLTGYHVLNAGGDPRAATILRQGYELLQQDAAALDEEGRQRFLTAVPLHRDLVATYEARQAQHDQARSEEAPGDTVTESSNHPTTQLPSHLLPPSPLLDWGEMPMVDFFVERTAEVAQLTAWLTPTTAGGVSAQLLSILGMGGIGKTTLAAAVTKAVAPSFAMVIWRSLINAPPPAELLRNWLQILSRQTLTTPPDSLDEQLRLLLTYLQQERCLLVLDNVESIFAADNTQGQAGVTRPGYEGYDQLFQRLASSDHQSCLLLTSREQPYALLRAGRQAQAAGRVQLLSLTGLDPQAGSVLLQSNGLHASVTEAAQLVENYSGNPLALQIVAATIADFFGGDVAAFQQEEGQIFDGMRLVLDQQFARLSPLERDILIWLAIEREAITVPTLRNNFVQPVATAPLLEALQSLQNRSLLEKHDAGFTLQNVIIEYTTEYLIEQIYREIAGDKETRRGGDEENGRANLSPSPPLPLSLSFLNRFALLKAQAKQYVRQSQARLLLQPVADRLVTTVGRAELVARIPHLLDALRGAAMKKGYAGGNLLNLLVQLGEELSGYDFSHLPVWQADLSGLTFVNANLTGADLAGATFTAGITVERIAFQSTGELWTAGIRNGVLGLWRTIDRQIGEAFQCGDNLRGPLVFSPRGELVATSTNDYRIKIWSTNRGECLQTLTGQSSTVHTLAFSRDGAYLATFGADLVVYLWELQTGRCVQQLRGYKQGADALAFSPDGQLLATGGGDGLIQLWDTQSTANTGRRVAAWQAHDQPLGALAFSPDGRWLASGSHAGEIRLWAMAPIVTEARQLGAESAVVAPPDGAGALCQGHTGIIRALLFLPTEDPTNYLLASASDDRTARIWSLTGQLRYTLLGHTNALLALSVSPDGRQLASAGSDKQIFWWDVASGQALYAQQAHRSALHCLAFSPDGQLLASAGADQIVRLWQLDDAGMGQLRHSLRGHTRFIDSVAFSPDGQTIASGDADRTIRLWDRTTGQPLQTLRKHQGTVRALAFAPTSALVGPGEALLASAGTDHIIQLWSVGAQPRRETPALRQLIGHEADILALAFDQRGRHLVSGCADGTLRIWDVQSGATIHHLTGHTAPVTAVAINLDDRTIASSCFDLTVRLWDLTTGACLHVERAAHIGPNGVAFSHDGQYLAFAGNDLGIYLWPWRSYATNPPVSSAPLRGHMSKINALRFSPTTAHLASCSTAGTIRIWDPVGKRCTQILRAPGPYAGMQIGGVTGISEAQKAALRALGAVEE